MVTHADSRRSRLSRQKAALLDVLLAERREAEAPSGEVERTLCAIWTEAFGRTVGPLDDFFLLGGDSILSLRLAASAHARGLSLRGAQIFAHPTIRALAPHVGRTPPAGLGVGCAPRDARQLDLPLTPMQHGMLYQMEISGRPDVYVSQFVCTFPPDLDVDRMNAAWVAVAQRRAALRAALRYGEDGRPLMRIIATADLRPDVHDWTAWAPSDAARGLDTYIEAEIARGFDLSRAPLMRLAFVRCPDGAWRCVWTHHHLVLDGWSQLVLLEDVFEAYRTGAFNAAEDSASIEAFVHNQPVALTPEAASYWRDRFANAAACTFSRAEEPSAGTEIAAGALGFAVSKGLAHAAAAAGTSLAAVLEVAWAVVAAGLFRRADPVFGLVAAVRPPAPCIERLVWLCINTVPICVPLRPGRNLAGVLAEGVGAHRALQERLADPLPGVLNVCPQASYGSLLVLENFHQGAAAAGHALDSAIAPRDVRFRVREHHPLVCAVSGPAENLDIEIKIDRSWRVPYSAKDILERLKLAAARLIEAPMMQVLDHAAAVAEEREAQVRAENWQRLGPERTGHD